MMKFITIIVGYPIILTAPIWLTLIGIYMLRFLVPILEFIGGYPDVEKPQSPVEKNIL